MKCPQADSRGGQLRVDTRRWIRTASAKGGNRCFKLGQALARAVARFPKPLNVQVWGTGGMSHQLGGARVGLINSTFDQSFLDWMKSDANRLRRITHLQYIREAGTEGIELVMWLVMRGALSKNVIERHRFYHVPASNTAVGHLVIEPDRSQM